MEFLHSFLRRYFAGEPPVVSRNGGCFLRLILVTIEDVSINNEYEYENDFKPYSYSKSFSQLSMLAMTPSSSL